MGGLTLLIGCLIAVVFQILTFVVPGPLGVQGPPAAWVAWLGVLGGVVTLVGLPALYTVQPKRLAALGLLGMIGLFLALLLFEVVLDIIAATVFASIGPAGASASFQPPVWIIALFIVGAVLLLLGSVLFGMAILRTQVFPVWSGWALIVLGVLNAVPSVLPPTTLAITMAGTALTVLQLLVLAWMGYLLASRLAKSAVGAQA